MIEMKMNGFCWMVDRPKTLLLVGDHCQIFPPSQASDTTLKGLDPAQNLHSGLAEYSCRVDHYTTAPAACNDWKFNFYKLNDLLKSLCLKRFWKLSRLLTRLFKFTFFFNHGYIESNPDLRKKYFQILFFFPKCLQSQL